MTRAAGRTPTSWQRVVGGGYTPAERWLVAAWLPSLEFEGGPPPEAVSADAGAFAPALAGYFCSRAPLPIIPDAPHVRRVQLEQATTSLPWAARQLGLPPPDGPRSRRRA